MKRIITFFCFFALALVGMVLISGLSVNAATSDAYTITCNPGENADSEMNIVWFTDLVNTNTHLIYTKKSDTNWKDAITVKPVIEKCEAFVGVNTVNEAGTVYSQDTPFLRCVVNLEDLVSDTEYMYKVGQTNMSSVHYFKTGGATEYSAALIGDFHAYAKIPNRLKRAMSMVNTIESIDKSIDFCFDCGDTVAWGGSQNFWQINYADNNFENYFWFSVIGNHDNMDKSNSKNSSKYFAATHAFPQNGYEGEKGVCYYFVYSDTLFITLDNETMGTDNITEVQDWIRNAVASNPTKYIVVMEHYQWFYITNGKKTHYDRWYKFFDEIGVDLAIGGNHHVYARTDPMKNDTEDENGTMYIQISSSDGERGETSVVLSSSDMTQLPSTNTSEWQKQHIKYVFSEGGPTISGILMNVDQTGIRVSLYDRNGNKLDTGFVKAKRETPSLTEDVKDGIGSDVKFVQNNLGSQVLVLPNTLTGYTTGYEIYNGSKQIYSSNYKNAGSRYAALDLDNNTAYDLTLKVKFKDGTFRTYPVSLNTIQNTSFINGLKSVGNKLTWNVNDMSAQIDKYEIYLGEDYIGTSTTVSFDLQNPSYGQVYTVKALDKDGKTLDSLTYKFGTYGDLNKDGNVNEDDIEIIQKYINGEAEITSEVLEYADLNNDGKVNIQDACYIKLYMIGLIPSYTKQTCKVTFIGALGETIQEVEVEYGKDATPTFLGTYDYDVVSWIGDYRNVTQDTTIYAVYTKKGSN